MASNAGGIEMVSGGGILYDRFPPHLTYPRDLRYYLFEPAYRVDRWLRPDYWQGFEGVSEELPYPFNQPP